MLVDGQAAFVVQQTSPSSQLTIVTTHVCPQMCLAVHVTPAQQSLLLTQ
jgi:hypothetical protein